MTNSNQREYAQGNDNRWYYRDQETQASGTTYTNYFMQADAGRSWDAGSYYSTTEEQYSQATA